MTTPPVRKLLLFDIDGTLLTTGGAGERGFSEAFSECFGIQDDLSTIDFAGATDTGVARLLFDKHGLPPTAENHARFKAAYLPRLAGNLPDFVKGRVMPGVRELLPALRARPELALALLTGNFREAARLKLEFYGLAGFFDFDLSAFADDHPDRNCLGPAALARARERHGTGAFPEPARDALILGDTPRDIACARVCGASALAVCTGRHGREALEAAGPDFVFDTLADPAALAAILG